MSHYEGGTTHCIVTPLAQTPAPSRPQLPFNCLPSGAGARRLGTVCKGHQTQEFVSVPRRGGYRLLYCRIVPRKLFRRSSRSRQTPPVPSLFQTPKRSPEREKAVHAEIHFTLRQLQVAKFSGGPSSATWRGFHSPGHGLSDVSDQCKRRQRAR